MSNQEILERVIQKAIDAGWNDPIGIKQFGLKLGDDDMRWGARRWHVMVRLPNPVSRRMEDQYHRIEMIIFNHDFAKALWGDFCEYCTNYNPTLASGVGIPEHQHNAGWQYHLQQMVIADDPIAYLGKHLPE